MNKESGRASVSIICVSNNEAMLENCLARSVDAHLPTAPESELIVVENSRGQFSTAGAALNHGVLLARNDVCVFAHQDVYLHSLERLEEAASILLADPGIGMLGAIGIDRDRVLEGRIRDRVVLLGRTCECVTPVDSVDEVLFMARREQLVREPLADHPELAWHAYAVEYGARMRRAGARVVVGRVPLTHNSLTINLARLTEAHRHVGSLYPEQLPIVTTCGVVGGREGRRNVLRRHRWRYRWLRGTYRAYAARRAAGPLPVVLSDIRFDIDRMFDNCGDTNLTVVSLDPHSERDAALEEPVQLVRLGRTLAFRVADRGNLGILADQRSENESVLLTNLDKAALSQLRPVLRSDRSLIGFSESIGYWAIVGPAANASPDAWRIPSARPLGLQAV